ncbi:hypothetical protein HYU12_00430 [Candidatus Woesearchaeota archaeon]|nr:hypothetical protein [Candidatus Woesearchaeota archaeon]
MTELNKLPGLDFGNARKVIIYKLQAKGYEVLESSNSVMGVPVSIITGGGTESPHKSDFYEITRKFGLMYVPGVTYTQNTPMPPLSPELGILD